MIVSDLCWCARALSFMKFENRAAVLLKEVQEFLMELFANEKEPQQTRRRGGKKRTDDMSKTFITQPLR